MLGPSRLNSAVGLLLCFAAASVDCIAQNSTEEDPLSKYRTTETHHGLYEIREVAREFIRRENSKGKTHWQVGDPDIRVVVRRCAAVPAAKWMEVEQGERPTVEVVCSRTVKGSPVKTWNVRVPVAPS